MTGPSLILAVVGVPGAIGLAAAFRRLRHRHWRRWCAPRGRSPVQRDPWPSPLFADPVSTSSRVID